MLGILASRLGRHVTSWPIRKNLLVAKQTPFIDQRCILLQELAACIISGDRDKSVKRYDLEKVASSRCSEYAKELPCIRSYSAPNEATTRAIQCFRPCSLRIIISRQSFEWRQCLIAASISPTFPGVRFSLTAGHVDWNREG